jgi:anti-sigma regulatory factor (Ser/Thr protein kinase)
VASGSRTPGQRFERSFSQNDHTAPRQARAAVAALEEVDDQVRQDLTIVVSELVANAVRHAPRVDGARIELTVSRQASAYRVEVRDGGRGFDPRPEPGAEGGLGLVIVAEIAVDWGIVRGEKTIVWCELALTGR